MLSNDLDLNLPTLKAPPGVQTITGYEISVS